MEAELFRGRTAIVTGGARGIGLACAAKITAGGGRVALWDRDPERTKQSAAALKGAVAIAVDVTSEADVAKALAETEKLLAPPDILVASAGITGPNMTVAKYPVDAWRQVIDINLTGVFLTNRVVVDGMVQRGWGRIVNIASVAGKEGNPNASAYSASKAGVISLVQTTAYSLSGTGVRINAVCPGLIETGMTKPIFDNAKQRGTDGKIGQLNPLKRAGQPHELAAMGLFLASDEAMSCTGGDYVVDAGLTAGRYQPGAPGA